MAKLTGRISNFKLRIPNKYNVMRCCGSSHGWLFFHKNKFSLILLNPFSGTTFKIPNLFSSRFNNSFYNNGFEINIVLSKDPSLGSFEVLSTNRDKNVVAHMKFGDEFWSYSVKTSDGYFKSVAFYKDSMLAACNDGIVSLEKINGGGTSDQDRHESSLGIKICGELHPTFKKMSALKDGFCLVESTKGDLLMVCIINDFHRIFKIVQLNGRFEHILIANLDGHSLFVGKYDSILVLASNYPRCIPNSVYYSSAGYGNILTYEFKIIEFNLEDHSVRHNSTVKTRTEYQHELAVFDAAPWIVPSMKF